MPYRVTIERTNGAAPAAGIDESAEKLYVQTVDDLDEKLVIDAVNKRPRKARAPRKTAVKKRPSRSRATPKANKTVVGEGTNA